VHRLIAPALLAGLFAPHAAADVRVEARGGRIDLTATAAPLPDVLDRLARQLGMKVVYEGPVPRPLVTLTLQDRTPSEAILGVLEGLGLNFALAWDETGSRVRTLMVAGAAPVTATPASARPAPEPPRRSGFRLPPATQDTGDEGFDPEPDDSTAEPPTAPGLPAAGAATGAAPTGAGDGQIPGGLPGRMPAVIPSAPHQQFPVSPFAPQPPVLTPPPATGAQPQTPTSSQTPQ
jgi:hypothetical protein